MLNCQQFIVGVTPAHAASVTTTTRETSVSNREPTPLSTTLRVPRVTQRHWAPRKTTSTQHCVGLRPNPQCEHAT
jgi:hypothetical protein